MGRMSLDAHQNNEAKSSTVLSPYKENQRPLHTSVKDRFKFWGHEEEEFDGSTDGADAEARQIPMTSRTFRRPKGTRLGWNRNRAPSVLGTHQSESNDKISEIEEMQGHTPADNGEQIKKVESRTRQEATTNTIDDREDGIPDIEQLERECREYRNEADRANRDLTALKGDVTRMSERLRETKVELEQKRMELGSERRKRPDPTLARQWKDRADHLDKQLSAANGKVERMEEVMSENFNLNEEVQKARSLASAQDQELLDRLLRITDMERDLLTARDAYEEVQGLYHQSCDELARLKSERGSMLDDEFFRRQWKHLQSSVRTWAHRHFAGQVKKDWATFKAHEHPHTDIALLELSDECESILRLENKAPLIAEAHIWKFMESEIFDSRPNLYSKGLYWATTVRSELIRLEKFVRPQISATDNELRLAKKWKALTAQLLVSQHQMDLYGRRIPIHQVILADLVNSAIAPLKPWMSSGDEILCTKTLQEIIHSGIELDSHMNEQWAMYHVEIARTQGLWERRFGFPFDSRSMAPVDGQAQIQDGDIIGLVLSPTLVREGNPNGENYETRVVLEKSRVLLEQRSSKGRKTGTSRSNGKP
ncbi:hypothetical protein NA57DRAFT_71959 [Rhizodiscina lignyota]|uniref:Uncharacterized protein n=1 Tax=Rhizodiscina lignyota TaxID=1504668 RepID=A0A9P4IN41_9PEZI|nr:hypothetical protein NA57DRAFT_71959 [Rhizodiscina lignyota]